MISKIDIPKVITLAHGSGGIEMSRLIEYLIFSKVPDKLKKVSYGLGIDFPDDAAAIPINEKEYLVISVDSYTVNPIFFPGGDIGKLAACGSINDVLMLGGKPIAILDSIIVEEGFPIEDLEKIINSFMKVIQEENIALIGGDFKVMPRGQIDKIVITTVGIGVANRIIVDKNIKPGDKIIVSDYIANHGAVIMALQYGIDLGKSELVSDCKPLTKLMIPLIEKYGHYIHAARDPTRGGIAMALNDWAKASNTIIVIEEDKIPIRDEVKRYCEMIGIDPLYLACEGVALLAVDESVADEIVEFMHKLGFENAGIIGEVKKSERFKGIVLYKTSVGGFRILEPPRGELVPRIC